MIKRLAMLAACCLLAAAGPVADPDWPCVQRLVPTLTAGTLWGGHEAEGDWRSDPRLVAVVRDVAPRSVPAAEGAAAIERFAAGLPKPERPAVLARLFAGLVDETNVRRTQLIDRLRGIARRQRLLTEGTSRVTAELRGLSPGAPEAERVEVVQRRALMIREYEEIERTIRYACEAPGQMEAKLGNLAQAMTRALAD